MPACGVQESDRRDEEVGEVSEPEDVRPRGLSKRRDAHHQATKQELRAAAPHGLLIEDILRRIEFDDGMPSLPEFRALVDMADRTDPERPSNVRGAKWCRSHCWTGRCHFGGQCWYSHSGPRLVGFGRSQDRPPGTNKAPYEPMVEMALGDVDQEWAFAICFLSFEGQVVWGRDIGFAGSEMWGRFVASRRGRSEFDDAAGSDGFVARFVDVPQVLLERVVRGLTVEDLVPLALAAGHAVDWYAVVEERWPASSQPALLRAQRQSAAAVGAAAEGAAAAGAAAAAAVARGGPIGQLASLVEASRLAAQLLRWPPRHLDPGVSPGVSPGFSPGFSPLHAPLQSPSPQSPAWGSQSPPTCGPDGEALGHNPTQTLVAAVLEWTAASVEPACIRFESEVHSLCLHASLVVALSCNGELRVIRRSDLKQITSLKIKDASCFDICGELLIVGTVAPARLIAYDLSSTTPKLLRTLGLGARASVIGVLVRDSETCVCGVACEETPGSVEVLIIDCHGDLRVVGRRPAAGFVAGGPTGCLTADAEGALTLWDVNAHIMRCAVAFPKGPELRPGAEPPGPMMLAASSGPFVAASAPLRSGAPLWAQDLRASTAAPLVVALLAEMPAGLGGQGSRHTFRWAVDLIHVEGPLLVVLARAGGEEEWSLNDLDAPAEDCALAPQGPRLFAWHLPSCRPLLAGHATLPITTFARSHPRGADSASDLAAIGRLAFAGGRPSTREGRSAAYFVVVPGAGTVRRPSRRAGLPGPLRKSVNGSDIRARGLQKGQKIGRR